MNADSALPSSVSHGTEPNASIGPERDQASGGAVRFIYPAVATAVSVVFLVESIGLGFGTLQTPGAGLWPFSIAVVTIVLSLVQALVPRAGAAIPSASDGPGAKARARSLLLGGLILAYALLVNSVGYLILTAALVFFASLFVAAARWWAAALTSVVTTGLVYMVFATFLGIPLPAWPAV